MKKYLLLLFAFCCLQTFSQQHSTGQAFRKVTNRVDMNRLNLENKVVGKTALPMLYRFKEKKLILNGAGLRELLWVDVYACGLYVSSLATDAKSVIDNDEAMIVRMDILSKKVSQEKLVKAFHKGFVDANSEGVVKLYTDEMNEFLKYLKQINLKVTDKVDIVYEPNIGVSMYLNYKKLCTVGDLGFKKAVFNIWLSRNPVDKSLKPELLDGAKDYLLEK